MHQMIFHCAIQMFFDENGYFDVDIGTEVVLIEIIHVNVLLKKIWNSNFFADELGYCLKPIEELCDDDQNIVWIVNI